MRPTSGGHYPDGLDEFLFSKFLANGMIVPSISVAGFETGVTG